jgi:phosphoenolpyruvate synthase/pyruvate phosphate dikinase
MNETTSMIRWFSDLDRSHAAIVGSNNSSLGEMIGNLKECRIKVPDGF